MLWQRCALTVALASVVTATPLFAVLGSPTTAPTINVSTVENHTTITGGPKSVCLRSLHVDRWHPYFGAPQPSSAAAHACLAATASSCMRHVQAVLEEHFEGGGRFLERAAEAIDAVVDVSETVEAQAGVCAVDGTAFVPYIRLRSHTSHHANTRRGQYRRQLREAQRRRRQQRDDGVAAFPTGGDPAEL